MVKRNITRKEEEAFRLVSHEFKGLTVNQAARVMQVTSAHVRNLLQSIKKKCPQLFPILTATQTAILHGRENNASLETIAAGLGITIKSVKRGVTFLRRHKFLVNKPKVIAYSPLQDGQVVQKF